MYVSVPEIWTDLPLAIFVVFMPRSDLPIELSIFKSNHRVRENFNRSCYLLTLKKYFRQ